MSRSDIARNVFSGIAVATFLFVAWGSSDNSSPTPSTSAPKQQQQQPQRVGVGEEGVLDNGLDEVLCGVTKEAFDAYISAAVARDDIGIAKMILQGSVVPIQRGTKVKVIDSRIGVRRVRILEGTEYSAAYWVAMEHVKPK